MFWFEVCGCKDSREDLDENVNGIGGKALARVLRDALMQAGWYATTNEEVFAEDWGWCFFLKRADQEYMFGAHVIGTGPDMDEAEYLEAEWDEAGAFVEHWHRRGLLDRLLGRNRRDPAFQVEARVEFEAVLSGLSGFRKVKAEPSG